MAKELEWSKEVYENSLSSKCWWYTPYDDGWINGVGIAVDGELKQIVRMETDLRPVPEWAARLATIWINYIPACGHYLFPLPFLELASAIGKETASDPRHSCYSVQPQRKKEMADYCLCLDAWLAGSSPEAPVRELEAFGAREIDWKSVCSDLWEALGTHNELKDLLVEHYLHALRHSIKASRRENDAATGFGRDEYLGDYIVPRDGSAEFFEPGSSPRLRKIEDRLTEIRPDWREFSEVDFGRWWLCAPKAFRFLERDLWAIGKERPMERGEDVPSFLKCEDTYPNQDEGAAWWKSFVAALQGWWQGRPTDDGVARDVNQRLSAWTPTKRWLVRLLLRKLSLLEANGEFGWIVKGRRDNRPGTKPLVSGCGGSDG